MIAVFAFLPVLSLVAPPAQDAPVAAAKSWTQEELERVSNEIKADIETMRGMKFVRPVAVKVADKKDFLDYARKRQELTETPERRSRDETIAKMLGAIPPDLDLQAALEKLLEEQVGGFYDPSSNTFYLMESFGGDLARIILAHELTHALDDQHFDLDGKLKSLGQQTDAEWAFAAVVEGSGTSAMNQWTVQHLKDLDKNALLGSADLGTKGLADAPPFLWKPLLAAYLCGEGFLVKSGGMNIAMKAAKVDDVRRAFETPPRSSEQVLHPAKFWEPEKRDEPRKVEFDESKLPEGWEVLGEDTLGELYLGLVTTPVGERKGLDATSPFAILGIKYTTKASEGWGGDGALLLGKGDARALQLVTVWDSAEDAKEFFDACQSTVMTAGDGMEPTISPPGEQDEVVITVTSRLAGEKAPVFAWTIGPAAGSSAR